MNEHQPELPRRLFSWEELAWMIVIDVLVLAVLATGHYLLGWPNWLVLVWGAVLATGGIVIGGIRSFRHRREMQERAEVHRMPVPSSPPDRAAA
jgi:membrane protein YdbS with pleckstrin-like domain